MVPRLKAKGIQVITLPDGDGWQMQSCLFSTVVGRMLGDAWVDGVKTGKNKFTDPGYVAALSFIDTMFKDGVIPRADMQLGYGDGPTLFATGKAAFIIDGDWRQGFYITDKSTGTALIDPAVQGTDYAFINFPAIPGEKNPGVVSAIAGVGLGISNAIPKGSDREKAAVRLLQYYYSPEVQQIKLETGAFIPSMKGITSEKLEPFTQMMPKYYAGHQQDQLRPGRRPGPRRVQQLRQQGPAGHRARQQDPQGSCRGHREGNGRMAGRPVGVERFDPRMPLCGRECRRQGPRGRA